MWELYTFWAFVPLLLKLYAGLHTNASFNIPLLSFLIIAIGCLGCIVAGYLSSRIGTKRLASMALLSSGACCLVAPLLFSINAPFLFIGFLLFWGFVVIADSPLFSTLVAQKAPAQLKGTALTIVNSIGFFLTIVSIQLITFLSQVISPTICLMVLALGPILGLISLSTEQNKS
jgi:MFS family permease